MGKAKKRRRSEEECHPSKKCRQQDGEEEGEEGWSESSRGKMNTSVSQPIEFLYVEDRHKHKSMYRPECRNEGAKEPSQVSEVERPEAAIETATCAIKWGGSVDGERMEQGGDLMHRKTPNKAQEEAL